MRCQPQYQGQVYICLKNVQACLLCDEPAEAQMPMCEACETELPWLGSHCQTCALPLAADGLTCGECLLEPPAFEQVAVPWVYGFPVDSLITRFKHNAKWPFGHLLADVLGQYLQHRFAEDLPRPDVLLPVPLANKRLRRRGFNQAAMLARWLSFFAGFAVRRTAAAASHRHRCPTGSRRQGAQTQFAQCLCAGA